MDSLPPEVLQHILRQAVDTHPRDIELWLCPRGLSTLHSASLVSHAWFQLSTPLLYARISHLGLARYELLARTLEAHPARGRLIKSLALNASLAERGSLVAEDGDLYEAMVTRAELVAPRLLRWCYPLELKFGVPFNQLIVKRIGGVAPEPSIVEHLELVEILAHEGVTKERDFLSTQFRRLGRLSLSDTFLPFHTLQHILSSQRIISLRLGCLSLIERGGVEDIDMSLAKCSDLFAHVLPGLLQFAGTESLDREVWSELLPKCIKLEEASLPMPLAEHNTTREMVESVLGLPIRKLELQLYHYLYAVERQQADMDGLLFTETNRVLDGLLVHLVATVSANRFPKLESLSLVCHVNKPFSEAYIEERFAPLRNALKAKGAKLILPGQEGDRNP